MGPGQACRRPHRVVPQHVDRVVQSVQAVLHPGLLWGGEGGSLTAPLGKHPSPVMLAAAGGGKGRGG